MHFYTCFLSREAVWLNTVGTGDSGSSLFSPLMKCALHTRELSFGVQSLWLILAIQSTLRCESVGKRTEHIQLCSDLNIQLSTILSLGCFCHPEERPDAIRHSQMSFAIGLGAALGVVSMLFLTCSKLCRSPRFGRFVSKRHCTHEWRWLVRKPRLKLQPLLT